MSETTGTAQNSIEDRPVTSSDLNESTKNDQPYESIEPNNEVHDSAPNPSEDSNYIISNESQSEIAPQANDNEISPNEVQASLDSNNFNQNDLEFTNDNQNSSQINEIVENDLSGDNPENYTKSDAIPINQTSELVDTIQNHENNSLSRNNQTETANLAENQPEIHQQEGFEEHSHNDNPQQMEEQTNIQQVPQNDNSQQIPNQDSSIDEQQQNIQQKAQFENHEPIEHQQQEIEQPSKLEEQTEINQEQQIKEQESTETQQSEATEDNQNQEIVSNSTEVSNSTPSFAIESITASPANPEPLSEVAHSAYQFANNLNEITIEPVKQETLTSQPQLAEVPSTVPSQIPSSETTNMPPLQATEVTNTTPLQTQSTETTNTIQPQTENLSLQTQAPETMNLPPLQTSEVTNTAPLQSQAPEATTLAPPQTQSTEITNTIQPQTGNLPPLQTQAPEAMNLPPPQTQTPETTNVSSLQTSEATNPPQLQTQSTETMNLAASQTSNPATPQMQTTNVAPQSISQEIPTATQPPQMIPNQFQQPTQFMQMAAFVPQQQQLQQGTMMIQQQLPMQQNVVKRPTSKQQQSADSVQSRRYVASQIPMQHVAQQPQHIQYAAQPQQFQQGQQMQLHPRQQLQQLQPIQPFQTMQQMHALQGMQPYQPLQQQVQQGNQVAQYQQIAQMNALNQKAQMMQCIPPLQQQQQQQAVLDQQQMFINKAQKQPKYISAAPYPSLPSSQQIQEIIKSLNAQIEAEKAELIHLERAKKLGILKPVDYKTRDPKLEVQYHLGFIIPHQMVNIVQNQSHSRAVQSQARYVLSDEQSVVEHHRFSDFPFLRDQITRNEELAEPMLKTLGNWKSMTLLKMRNLVNEYVFRRGQWDRLRKSIDVYNHETRRTIDKWPPEFAASELKSNLAESVILSRVAPDEPMYLDDLEKKEFLFYDMNRFVEDPVAEHLAYKRRLVWTEAEIKTFLERYAQHPREFKRIATALPSKCVKDVIEFYNIHRIDLNLKDIELASRKKGMRKKMISEGSVRK